MNIRVTTEDIDALAYAIEATSGDRTHFETAAVLNWLAKNNAGAFYNLSNPDYLDCCLWFV